MKTVGFQDLFVDLSVNSHYPVKKFGNALPGLVAENDDYCLDFSGIEQLADEVFFIMETVLSEKQRSRITCLMFVGCIHLTDKGIYILSKCFSRLEELNLSSCSELTERSLFSLLTHCKTVKKVNMDYTSLSLIPAHLNNIDLSYKSCPVILNLSDPTFKQSTKHANSVKLIILVMDNISLDIAHLLATGQKKMIEPCSPIIVRENALVLDGVQVNVIELHCDEAYFSLFLTERSLYMLVIRSGEAAIRQSMKGIDFVRGVIPQAPITVLTLIQENSLDKVKEFDHLLQMVFKDQVVHMAEHLEKEHFQRAVDKDFPHQWRYVQSMECARPEYFPIAMIGMCEDGEVDKEWNYFSTIRAIYSVQQFEEMISKWMNIEMNDALDSIERINKSDIQEVLSLSKLSPATCYVVECVLVLLIEDYQGFPNTDSMFKSFKEIGKQPSFLRNIQSYLDNINSKDSKSILGKLNEIKYEEADVIDKIQYQPKLISALYSWVCSIWHYMENIHPIRLQLERQEIPQNISALTVLRDHLKRDLMKLKDKMYQWMPPYFDESFDKILDTLPKEKQLLSVSDYLQHMKQPVNQDSLQYYHNVFTLASIYGEVLYFPKERILVTDVPWFAGLTNHFLQDWNTGLNNDRVWSLGRHATLATKPQLIEYLKPLVKEKNAIQKYLSLLHSFGLLGNTVDNLMVTQGINRAFASSVGSENDLLFSWCSLKENPCLRTGIKPEEISYKKRHYLAKLFPESSSGEESIPNIVFKFTFKFRIGMPANLFPRIVSVFMSKWRVMAAWKTGILMRHSVLTLLIEHNLHATMASSSIDMHLHTARLPGNFAYLQQYIWHFMSSYITTIESIIVDYPHTHHKLRYYCRGECDLKGMENTFSPVEIDLSFTRNISCSKCKNYQMPQEEWQFLIGRQYILPLHDLDEDKSCKNCWQFYEVVHRLWEEQCHIFPVFTSLCFTPVHPHSYLLGNLLLTRAASDDETISTVISSILPLSSYGFREMKVQIFLPEYLTITISSATEPEECFEWQPGSGQITNKMIENIPPCTEDEAIDPPNVQPMSSGHFLQFKVIKSTTKLNNEGDEISFEILRIRINNETTTMHHIKPDSVLHFNTKTTQSREICARLECRTFPAVGSHHFQVGMILLYKTGVGALWYPGVVEQIIHGQLWVRHLENGQMEGNGVWFSPNSPDLCPMGLYPDDINAVINKRQIKGYDSWYDFLDDYPDYKRAPFAFFQRLINKPQYKPLPHFKLENRLCCQNLISSGIHIRTLNSARPTKQTRPAVFLPQDLDTESLFTSSMRSIEQTHGQSILKLCEGNHWVASMFDIHLLNQEPHNLSNEEMQGLLADHIIDYMCYIRDASSKRKSFRVMQFQDIDKCFPKIDPEIDRRLLYEGVVSNLKSYRDCFIIRQILAMPPSMNCTIIDRRSAQRKFTSTTTAAPRIQKRKTTTQVPATQVIGLQQFLDTKAWNVCDSHMIVRKVLEHDQFGEYSHCVSHVKIKNHNITDYLDRFPRLVMQSCINLFHLELTDCGLQDLHWLKDVRPGLSALHLHQNQITEMTEELRGFSSSLAFLHLSFNPIKMIPEWIAEFGLLRELNIGGSLINELPQSFGNLKELRNLDLCCVTLKSLPQSFSNLKKLSFLKITGPADPFIQKGKTHRGGLYPYPLWTNFTTDFKKNGYCFSNFSQEKLDEMFSEFDRNNSGVIDADEWKLFVRNVFNSMPRLCSDEDSEFPMEIFGCLSLKKLHLSNQALKSIPPGIRQLKQLTSLILTNNPYLETISGEICKTNLAVLDLGQCDMLKTPPREICSQGMQATIGYLKRLAMGSTACYRTKLMFVGLGGAGKTSLMRALMSDGHKSKYLDKEEITDGIDIHAWTIRRQNEPVITYSVWDFAGQTLYYNTHQFFLTSRAIYLLVWNIRQGYEHTGLIFWLNSISCHAPKAPIFIVGTHADKVHKMEIPINELMKKYPSIAGFFSISSLTGMGVPQLLNDLIEVTKIQPYIGEQIPEAWLRFEQEIISMRSKNDYLQWGEIKTLARHNAIYDEEIKNVVQFLHDLGSVQFFDNDLLRDKIIINSQWLVDVMACVVSVHNSVIQEGRFHHKDIPIVWANYNKDIHEWLLRLTEIFDLTFPLTHEPVNVVPCLLAPSTPEELQWGEPIKGDKEAKMLYVFEYLPAGLFNRAQVRLCQYSDSHLIWQRGSFLQKNDHKALITRKGENELVVSVQGVRPGNIILLVHEIFESLIEQQFQGVSYEYFLPCFKCIQDQISEPQLFGSRVLRRAIELHAMFLQCHNQFHCLSVEELHNVMPPESVKDYDIQFERSLQDLVSAEKGLTTDIMLVYSKLDLMQDQSEEVFKADPSSIYGDLTKLGISVWYEDNMEAMEFNDLMTAMTKTQLVGIFISQNFTTDHLCHELFELAHNVLKKPIRLLVVGEGKSWQQTDIGMKIVGDKYFNFQRKSQYQAKIEELSKDIREFLKSETKPGLQPAQVFLSYCWDNSLIAVEKGDCKVRKEEALGYGDPRKIKDSLESRGIPCWLDVERVGTSSLYAEICEGLISCKMVIACVSDEYSSSDTCRKEFLFALRTLNRPVIIVVVGTGNQWELSEIGFNSIDIPKIDFQKNEPSCFDELYQKTAEMLADAPDVNQNDAMNNVSQKSAFHEQCELVQRKLFRLLLSYSDDTINYPRIFVIDFWQESNEKPLDNMFHEEKSIEEDSSDDDAESPMDDFCFKILCEHEEGWHAVHPGFQIDLDNNRVDKLFTLSAPYLARISLLLKHSSSDLQFASSTSEEANNYLKTLEENAGDWSHVKGIYEAFRDHVMKKDVDSSKGGLTKCYLPSGKSLWLCPKHQKTFRVTALSGTNYFRQTSQGLKNSLNDEVMNIDDQELIHNLEILHEEKEAPDIKDAPSKPAAKSNATRPKTANQRKIEIANAEKKSVLKYLSRQKSITTDNDKLPLQKPQQTNWDRKVGVPTFGGETVGMETSFPLTTRSYRSMSAPEIPQMTSQTCTLL